MGLLDKVETWYLRTILARNIEDYSSPGILFLKWNSPVGKVFTRIILIPEEIIINLEKEIILTLKDEGKELLYSIGKFSGYNLAKIFRSPRLKINKEEEVKKYIEFILKFNFSTWANGGDLIKLNTEKKEIITHFKDRLVCSKNGIGLILTSGLDSGFIAYTFNDINIDGFQTKCQGKNNKYCELVIGTQEFLNNFNYKPIRCNEILDIDLKDSKYVTMNTLRPCKYAKSSLKSLLETKIFKISNGKINYQNISFINISDFFIYALEKELSYNNNAKEILYKVSFESGKNIESITNFNFIINFISALGWGDLIIRKENEKYFCYLDLFPWRNLEKEIPSFELISGFISGMISKYLKKELNLRKTTKFYKENKFALKMESI